MKRKILTSLMIVTLAHYLMGCAEYDTVYVSDPRDLSEGSKILHIQLQSDELISFNEDRGELVFLSEVVAGRSRNGNVVSVPVGDITKVYGGEYPKLITIDMLRMDSTIRVSQIWYSGGSITFDENKGKYLLDSSNIKGTTVDGEFVKIPFSEIKMVVVEIVDMNSSVGTSIGWVEFLGVLGALSFFLLMTMKW